MRWNCPHCKLGLEAADNLIAPHWSFSLCPKCMRFGLIRTTNSVEATIVKVDRAPAGEKFIRATPTEAVPIVRPAQPRSKATETAATQAVPVAAPVAKPIALATVPGRVATPPKFQLPDPLPEVPERRPTILPRLVIFGCIGMLFWNGYRYWSIRNEQRTPVQVPEMSDQVVAKAMAPTRIEVGSQIEPRSDRMQIRNGPGYQFPVIGVLAPSKRYAVVSISDSWYQLEAGTKTPAWVTSDEIAPSPSTP